MDLSKKYKIPLKIIVTINNNTFSRLMRHLIPRQNRPLCKSFLYVPLILYISWPDIIILKSYKQFVQKNGIIAEQISTPD